MASGQCTKSTVGGQWYRNPLLETPKAGGGGMTKQPERLLSKSIGKRQKPQRRMTQDAAPDQRSL